MPSILFVCTGNQYRSPLAAAAFLKHVELDKNAAAWTVNSAGTWTSSGLPPLPDALRVARDLGLNLADHKTSALEAHALAGSDLVLVMEQGHKEAILSEFPSARGRVHLLSEAVDQTSYDIPDPAAPDVDLTQVARQVYELIGRGYGSICKMV
jgi:protein-tyrosine phosphatase